MNPASKLNVVINKAPAPSNWFLEDRYLGMFMHKRKGQDDQTVTLPFEISPASTTREMPVEKG
jgi:hypothetical protein